MNRQNRPGGLAPAPAEERCHRPERKARLAARQPRCAITGLPIAHELPPHCPLAVLDPLTAIGAAQEIAWSAIGSQDQLELGEALQALEDCAACLSCLDSTLTHPVVRRLRGRKARAA